MKLNAAPKPLKDSAEKPREEVTNQVEVIQGVLGKLKVRSEATNGAPPQGAGYMFR